MGKISDYFRLVETTDESLSEHDRRWHPNGYSEGDDCKLREKQAGGDKADSDLDPDQGKGHLWHMANSPEYRMVYEAWHNQDGSAKDGYLKAPNGRSTNLSPVQWVMVRTPSFKKWFGDWERKARIEKLRNSPSIDFKWKAPYELNRKSARSWALANLKADYVNADTGDTISVARDGLRKVTSHGTHDDIHLKSIAAIPEIIKNSIFIDERPNYKNKHDYDKFRYYVSGINIDGVPHTAKVVVGVKDGIEYYDHDLTQIEKGTLIESASNQPSAVNENSLDGSYDTKLIDLLQVGNVSKVVDDNGEPMVVWKGNSGEWTVARGKNFFSSNEEIASVFDRGKGTKISFFLNIVNPVKIGGYKSSYGFHSFPVDAKVAEEIGLEYSDIVPELGGESPEGTERVGVDTVVEKTMNAGKGFDGVIAEGILEGANALDPAEYQMRGNDYVTFSPGQIKSADPVTYDDSGNVIPLSMRFDDGNDIRGNVR